MVQMTLKLDPGQLRDLEAKLVKGRITKQPRRDLLDGMGSLGVQRVKKYAPNRTGALGGSFQKQFIERGDEAAVKVYSNFTRGGFRLAHAMDKSKRFHYRSGGPRGRPTGGYLSKRTLRDVRLGSRRLATQFNRDTENLWARKAV